MRSIYISSHRSSVACRVEWPTDVAEPSYYINSIMTYLLHGSQMDLSLLKQAFQRELRYKIGTIEIARHSRLRLYT